MDNSLKFKELREKYKEFIYEDYEIKEVPTGLGAFNEAKTNDIWGEI